MRSSAEGARWLQPCVKLVTTRDLLHADRTVQARDAARRRYVSAVRHHIDVGRCRAVCVNRPHSHAGGSLVAEHEREPSVRARWFAVRAKAERRVGSTVLERGSEWMERPVCERRDGEGYERDDRAGELPAARLPARRRPRHERDVARDHHHERTTGKADGRLVARTDERDCDCNRDPARCACPSRRSNRARSVASPTRAASMRTPSSWHSSATPKRRSSRREIAGDPGRRRVASPTARSRHSRSQIRRPPPPTRRGRSCAASSAAPRARGSAR